MTPRLARAGFSLIEALVVLAIGGMALAVIFTIGIRAGDTGFGLGRRAMAAADSDVAISDLRSIVRSIALRPPSAFVPDIDTPMTATPERLEAEVVMARATVCAPQGWSGRLVLALEPRGATRVLSCTAGGRRVEMMTLPSPAVALSYSIDGGQSWRPRYTNDPAGPDGRPETLQAARLWVRLAAPPFVDVIEQAASGRPEAWLRPDAPI